MSAQPRHVFWSRTLRLTLALLAVWLLVNLAVPWFARDLNRWHGFGFPAGYWLAAEGALLAYLALVVAYAVLMDRLDARYLDAMDSIADDTPGAGPA